MATAYSEFDTTSTNVVADIKTKILLSADWANITGNIVKATTTRGAQMVVDLANAAATTRELQFGVYRTHNGTTGVDKLVRYVMCRPNASTPLTTDPLHCRVSAGKEHLFISLEGPRRGENAPDDATNGSGRSYFWLGDLVPYFSGDTVPAVVLIASTVTGNYSNQQTVWVSRDATNSLSWVPAGLVTLTTPRFSDHTDTGSVSNVQRTAAADSNKVYLSPYVVVDEAAGIRGRLAKAFFAGWNEAWTAGDPMVATFSRCTYDSETYIVIPPGRSASSTANCLAFGQVPASTTYLDAGPLVAIPQS